MNQPPLHFPYCKVVLSTQSVEIKAKVITTSKTPAQHTGLYFGQ